MSKYLEKPGKKFFLIDLRNSSEIPQEVSTSASQSQRKEWLTSCAGIKVRFSVVSVQGIIVQTLEDGNVLYIDDGTSLAAINGCNVLPFTTIKPCKGHYVMIVGQLHKAGEVPLIRPMKLQNLSHNVSLSVIWPLEVIDSLQQHGNG